MSDIHFLMLNFFQGGLVFWREAGRGEHNHRIGGAGGGFSLITLIKKPPKIEMNHLGLSFSILGVGGLIALIVFAKELCK